MGHSEVTTEINGNRHVLRLMKGAVCLYEKTSTDEFSMEDKATLEKATDFHYAFYLLKQAKTIDDVKVAAGIEVSMKSSSHLMSESGLLHQACHRKLMTMNGWTFEETSIVLAKWSEENTKQKEKAILENGAEVPSSLVAWIKNEISFQENMAQECEEIPNGQTLSTVHYQKSVTLKQILRQMKVDENFVTVEKSLFDDLLDVCEWYLNSTANFKDGLTYKGHPDPGAVDYLENETKKILERAKAQTVEAYDYSLEVIQEAQDPDDAHVLPCVDEIKETVSITPTES